MATVSAAGQVSESAPETPESSRSSLSASADSSLSASTSTSVSVPPLKRSSILRTSSSFTLPARSNVSFAPLPSTEPRRRKSNVQLGVAARSRMLHHRRLLREHGIHPSVAANLHAMAQPEPVPLWAQEPDDAGEDDLGPDPAEQAFAAIGRFVKGASRTLFRRVSSKDTNRAEGSPQAESTPVISMENKREVMSEEEEAGGNSWQRLKGRTRPDSAVNSGSRSSDAGFKKTAAETVTVTPIAPSAAS